MKKEGTFNNIQCGALKSLTDLNCEIIEQINKIWKLFGWRKELLPSALEQAVECLKTIWCSVRMRANNEKVWGHWFWFVGVPAYTCVNGRLLRRDITSADTIRSTSSSTDRTSRMVTLLEPTRRSNTPPKMHLIDGE